MTKAIYFDMDNTIADLYSVPDWEPLLQAEKVLPYQIAEPMYNIERLERALARLQSLGIKIGIISWLSMEATKKYDDRVRYAKKQWIKDYFKNIEFDELHFLKYGRNKYDFAKTLPALLIDDNDKVRAQWEEYGGRAIYPDENLIEVLEELGK